MYSALKGLKEELGKVKDRISAIKESIKFNQSNLPVFEADLINIKKQIEILEQADV